MKNVTDITFVLDKSGSMSHVTDDTIGNFNEFLKDQQNEPGEAVFSLYQFATELVPTYIVKPIKEAEQLTKETYTADGRTTALRDAIGHVITQIGTRLSSMKEEERPEKVIVVIQTDGFENDSRQYSQSDIQKMIEHQESKYNWKFIFLGAGLDVMAQGQNLGMKFMNSLAYANTAKGNEEMYKVVSAGVKRARGMSIQDYSATVELFSTEEKEELEKDLK